MSAKSLIATVVGFLTHHVTDLNAIADTLSSVTGALPIDSQDKDRIGSLITTIKNSADNITSFLENTTVTNDAGDVVVKESDIETAVANVLPNLVAKTVEAYLAAHPVTSADVVSAEGNVTNG